VQSNIPKIYFIRANKTLFGGAENYLSRFSKALTEKGIEHKIIHSNFSKLLPSWLRVIMFNLQVSLIKGNKFYFSLDRIICPDIYRAGDGVHKVFLTFEKKSKLNPLHMIYIFLEKKSFINSKKIITNSCMVKNEIINVYDIDENKIKVVYNGVEIKKFNYINSYNKLSSEFMIDNSEIIILYAGSGFKRKGVEEFIKIISLIKDQRVKAFIVGKDKNFQYFKKLAKDYLVDNKIIFTGEREDIDNFYTVSDIFILPTHYDPFSNVILEAMSFNNAVFTTRQNGASEILENEFIMNNPNDFSIVKKIVYLINNPNELKKIKAHNLTVVKEFSIEKNLFESIKVVDEVIN
jgi:UDP-glucose:(heptosyl)LPS alpha-1,3-glucosyltransferase